MQMINEAGKYKVKKNKPLSDSLIMNVNLCWVDNSFLNDSIIQALKELLRCISIKYCFFR